MNNNKNLFWLQFAKPFMVLAPMEDVTDTVFRQIVASVARPDVFFTEFMNCDGFMSDGRFKVAQRLKFSETEHPIIAQIWGNHPESYYETAKALIRMGFDGVDINMGCPQKKIMKTGGGGALIDNKPLAARIVKAARQGMDDAGGKNLPLSVKTRIGNKSIVTKDWISFLLSLQLEAVTIHCRTVKEQSSVAGHWEEIGKAVEIRNTVKSKIIIIGNGDVKDRADADIKHHKYGVDGVMIGRGIFHNLWAFGYIPPTSGDKNIGRIKLCQKHLELFDTTWNKAKPFNTMKKFFKIYIQGFSKAGELRNRLMLANSISECMELLTEYINSR